MKFLSGKFSTLCFKNRVFGFCFRQAVGLPLSPLPLLTLLTMTLSLPFACPRCPAGFAVMNRGTFWKCLSDHPGLQAHVATEHLKCGWCDQGTERLIQFNSI